MAVQLRQRVVILTDLEPDDMFCLRSLQFYVGNDNMTVVYIQGKKCTPQVCAAKLDLYRSLNLPQNPVILPPAAASQEFYNDVLKDLYDTRTTYDRATVVVICPTRGHLWPILSLLRVPTQLVIYSGTFNITGGVADEESKTVPTLLQELEKLPKGMFPPPLEVNRHAFFNSTISGREAPMDGDADVANFRGMIDFENVPYSVRRAWYDLCTKFNLGLMHPRSLFYNWEAIDESHMEVLLDLYSSLTETKGEPISELAYSRYVENCIRVHNDFMDDDRCDFVGEISATLCTRARLQEVHDEHERRKLHFPHIKHTRADMLVLSGLQEDGASADCFLAFVYFLRASTDNVIKTVEGTLWQPTGSRFPSFAVAPTVPNVSTGGVLVNRLMPSPHMNGAVFVQTFKDWVHSLAYKGQPLTASELRLAMASGFSAAHEDDAASS